MELSKEKLLEIAERKEKCIKCDMEKLICVACDNFVCANKAWREEIAFYEQVRELAQADAEGRLVVLPCKEGEMTNADKIRSLSNEELAILLVHGTTPTDFDIPQCDEWCEHYKLGCFAYCPDGKREEFMREWLEQEAD